MSFCLEILKVAFEPSTGLDLAKVVNGNGKGFCTYRYNEGCRNGVLTVLTMIMMLDALVVFFISIWGIVTNSTAIEKAKVCASCCRCCDDSSSRPQAPVVIYMPVDQVRKYAWREQLILYFT